MAGQVSKDDNSYEHFNAGVDSKTPPLTTVDRKILDFAVRSSVNPNLKTQGQILRNFGMYPPEFWNRAQSIANHPDIAPEQRAKLDGIFPDPSRPGPMTGGYDVKLGLEQYP